MTQERADLVEHPSNAGLSFLAGGGELGARIRARDWSTTSLGPAASWPASLKTCVRVVLTSRQPMFVWWGPELINLYNDAYKSIVGGKHPQALGQPAHVVWREIWDEAGSRARHVIETNEGTYDEALLLIMERHGYQEETYYTFSYSPVPNEDGSTGGLICANTDDTQRIVGERELALLRDVASLTAKTRTIEDACRETARALETNPKDVPFALLYLESEGGKTLTLQGTAGIPIGHALARTEVELVGTTRWPFREVLRSGEVKVVDLPAEDDLPLGSWPRPARHAIVLPIAASGRAAVLIVGASPFRAVDESYLRFLRLVAGHIGASLTRADEYEAAKKRAEALAEIDRAKTAFFSNVSHELRTPLTLILGPLDDLARREQGIDPAMRGELEMIKRNAGRLLKLVNTLLDFSRIEAGRVEAAYRPTDLSAYTAELVSTFRSATERAGLKLVVDCPPLPEPIFVDREMWEKIVLNLVSNALKFTFEGEIEIQLRATGDEAILAVRDTGTGIPPESLPHVFERFHRIRGARSRTHEGTGIGLALVHELVRLHGGSSSVESKVDIGTTFTIRIPRGSQHLAKERLEAATPIPTRSPRADAFVEEAMRWLPNEGPDSTPALPQRERTPRPATAGAHVLLADDNADMREYVERLLSEHWNVTAVADGKLALEKARDAAPDLIVSDVMMPGLDGFQLVRALRDDERTRDVPVVLLSARAGEEAVGEGLASGANDYLVKPFSSRELVVRIGSQLELARLRRASEGALRESEERFRNMADDAPVMMWVADATGVCSYLNRRWYELTGQTKESGLGNGWLAAIHPEDGPRVERAFQEARTKRGPFSLEMRVRRHDGVYRWTIDTATPRIGSDGELIGYIGSILDIDERKNAERALEEASRAKDEFLAVVSHELRTPLSSILGWSTLLLDGNLSPDAAKKAMPTIERNARAQAQLIDDLLDVSRIITGKLRLSVETVDIGVVATSAMDVVRPAADAKGVMMLADVSEDVGRLVGDPDRLQQVIWNLLSNGVKFTPRGGRVELRVERSNSSCVIIVEDTGAGIAPEFLPFVFERFRQENASTTRSFGGLGLGLAIVRHLVELHGGTIEVSSPGPKAGAKFTVRLPIAATQSSTRRVSDHAPEPPPSAPLVLAELQGLRILVVDDQDDAREMLGTMLEHGGAVVHTADSVDAALNVVDQTALDVIVSDIGMPVEDGYTFAAKLRARPADKGGRIPALALTAYARVEERTKALRAGYDAHVAKPVDPNELVVVIAKLAGRLS